MPVLTIQSDASTAGWGAYCEMLSFSTGGMWLTEETFHHINVLELKAAFLALQSVCKNKYNIHVKLLMDNTTAVSYIREMGGSHSLECNCIAREIWLFTLAHKLWITPCHISGSENTFADKESRSFKLETEWMLDHNIFNQLCNNFAHFNLDIDLFASRINNQLPVYASWRPDPGAKYIDAFTVTWSNLNFYAFPPFSIVGKVLQKINHDKAKGVLVVPKWPTAHWWPTLLHMSISAPFSLPRGKRVLQQPSRPTLIHPLHRQLQLQAFLLSGAH